MTEDRLEVDEETEINWRQYLATFTADVYPIFQQVGLSIPEAIQVWMSNRLYNAVHDLLDTLEAEHD